MWTGHGLLVGRGTGCGQHARELRWLACNKGERIDAPWTFATFMARLLMRVSANGNLHSRQQHKKELERSRTHTKTVLTFAPASRVNPVASVEKRTISYFLPKSYMGSRMEPTFSAVPDGLERAAQECARPSLKDPPPHRCACAHCAHCVNMRFCLFVLRAANMDRQSCMGDEMTRRDGAGVCGFDAPASAVWHRRACIASPSGELLAASIACAGAAAAAAAVPRAPSGPRNVACSSPI